jgi:hypothetical protein
MFVNKMSRILATRGGSVTPAIGFVNTFNGAWITRRAKMHPRLPHSLHAFRVSKSEPNLHFIVQGALDLLKYLQ